VTVLNVEDMSNFGAKPNFFSVSFASLSNSSSPAFGEVDVLLRYLSGSLVFEVEFSLGRFSRNPGVPVVDFFSDFGAMLMSSDVNVRQAEKLGVQRPSPSQASKFSLFLCVCIDSHARARFELVSTGYPPFCSTSLFIVLA
jgi:hypothetical protein